MAYENLGLMFQTICEKYPDKAAYMSKKEGNYESITYREVQTQVKYLAAALEGLGAKKDDKILLLSENRLEWAISDFAILSCGSVTVPIYPTLLPKHIEFIINNAEGKIIIVSQEVQLKKIMEIRKNLPQIEHIILMEGPTGDDLLSWSDIMEKGKSSLDIHNTWFWK